MFFLEYIPFLLKALIIGGSLSVGLISHYILKPKDTTLEHVVEEIIKEETGIDIKFDPEKNNSVDKNEIVQDAQKS